MSLVSASRFYTQLGMVHRAGLPIADSILHAGSVSGGIHQRLARSWSDGCRAGGAFSAQLADSDQPPMAVALMAAAEKSGRMPEIARMLGDYYQHLIDIRNAAIGRLIYPIFLLHAALIVPAIKHVFVDSASPLWLLAGPATLWCLVALGAIVFVTMRSSGLLGRLALVFPIRFLAMPLISANTYRCLEAAVVAGFLVPEALELTAGTTVVQEMSERMRQAASGVRNGGIANLADALASCGYPGLEVGMVRNGEIAGKTEEVLRQLGTLALESFRLRSTWTAKCITATVYAIAAVSVAYVVISFYAGYVGQIKELAQDT